MDFLDDLDEEDSNYFPKGKRTTIDIPTFVEKKEYPEEASAVLNNTPGNVELEEMKHLNGIEELARNLTEEEWKRYLYHTPSVLMFKELQRRMSGFEEYRNALVGADEVMKKINL